MNARDLTVPQLARLRERAARDLSYHRRLIDRMDARGWDKSCPAYVAAVDAAGALSDLVTELQRLESEILGGTWAVLRAAGMGKHGK